MKYFRFVLPVILSAIPAIIYSQCTPDLSLTQAGIYPNPIPPAYEGIAYSEVIDFVFPEDTTFLGNDITLDSIRVDSLVGLPATFSAEFDKPGLTYPGGSNGCALVTGNPAFGMAGTYPVNFHFTAFFLFLGNPTSLAISDVFFIEIKSTCSQTYVDSASGLYPDPFPPGFENSVYDENINIVFRADTLVDTNVLTVDSVQVLSITGLPTGFSDSCYKDPCIFPSGASGCVSISGDPQIGTKGDYLIDINLRYYLEDTTTIDQTYGSMLHIGTPLDISERERLSDFSVSQNFPNPFSNLTHIRIVNREPTKTFVTVYDHMARKISVQMVQGKGTKTVTVDGNSFSPGIYYYHIQNGRDVKTGKMVLVRP